MSAIQQMLLAGSSIAFVSSSVNHEVSSETNTVTAPTGIQDGDVLIAISFNGGISRSISSYPSGFSQLFIDSTGTNATTVASKVASSESGDYSFTWNSSGRSSIVILVYRAITNSGPLFGALTRTDSFAATATSISPTGNGVLIAAFFIEDSTTISVPPSGMALRSSQSSDPACAIYDLVPSPAGATGDKTAVWASEDTNIGLLFQFYQA